MRVRRKRISICDRVHCVFPVTRITKYLRNYTKMRVSPTAGVFLAAIAQSTIEDILILGRVSACSRKYKRIQPRDVLIGMNADHCLYEVYKSHRILMRGAGMVPNHMTPQRCADHIMNSPSPIKRTRSYAYAIPISSPGETTWEGVDISPGPVNSSPLTSNSSGNKTPAGKYFQGFKNKTTYRNDTHQCN